MNTHTHGYKPTSSWPKVITTWQPMPFTCTLPAPASINIFPCYSLTLPLTALNQVLKGLKTARRHLIHCRDGRLKYKWMHSLSKPQQMPNTLLWWVLEKNALWTATFTYSVEAVTLFEKWHCNSMIPHKSLNHLALSRTRPHRHTITLLPLFVFFASSYEMLTRQKRLYAFRFTKSIKAETLHIWTADQMWLAHVGRNKHVLV